jgi:hypothetical protein
MAYHSIPPGVQLHSRQQLVMHVYPPERHASLPYLQFLSLHCLLEKVLPHQPHLHPLNMQICTGQKQQKTGVNFRTWLK